MHRSYLLALLASAASFALAAPALAADAPASPSAAPAASTDIVVTASKRTERLREVPMAVSAVTDRKLDQIQATSLSDFILQVPGVNFTQSAQGAGTLTIRGINAGGVASTVGVYIDEIPFGSSTALVDGAFLAADIDPFDLQRVEVLKGPQGTLYGAGALGGVVNYVTNAPSTAGFSGKVEAGVESVDHGGVGEDVKGVVNVPIDNQLALRVSGYDQNDPGYIDNPVDHLDQINSSSIYGGRASLLWTPTDKISVRLTAIGQSITDQGGPTESIDPNPTGPSDIRPLFGDLKYVDAIPEGLARYQVRYGLYNADLNWDLDWAKLSSSTSYGTLNSTQRFDFTDLAGDFLTDLATTDKFTEEARLASPKSDWLEWQVGVYYTRETGDLDQVLTRSPAGGVVDLSQSLPSTFEEEAVFGDVTYHFTPQIDLQVGGRYAANQQTGGQVGESFGTPFNLNGKSNDDDFTWSVAPRWRPTKDTMVYARFATGYNPGGPNVINVITSPKDTPTEFGPESLIDYEVGVKTSLFDNRLLLDVDAYHIDWNKIQLLAVVGSVAITANGGTATSNGIEWDATWLPIHGLNLSWGGAYSDAHLTSNAPGVGAVSGEQLPLAPKFTTTLSGDYEFPFFDDHTAFVGATVRYMDQQGAGFISGFAFNQFILPSYTTVDLRAGVNIDKVKLEVFAKNVGDVRAFTGVAQNESVSGGGLQATIITPRTVGVSMTAAF